MDQDLNEPETLNCKHVQHHSVCHLSDQHLPFVASRIPLLWTWNGGTHHLRGGCSRVLLKRRTVDVDDYLAIQATVVELIDLPR